MEKGNASSFELQTKRFHSPFKNLRSCLIIENNSFQVSFGYSVLELLVRFRENTTFLLHIWNFFDNDQDLKQIAKEQSQLSLFTFFKQLLNFISIGKYIEDLNDLRSFILSKKYWIPCINFYFSMPEVMSKFPVHIILYQGQNYELLKSLNFAGPLILIAKQDEAYYPADLSNFKHIENMFPFSITPSVNLAPYLEESR